MKTQISIPRVVSHYIHEGFYTLQGKRKQGALSSKAVSGMILRKMPKLARVKYERISDLPDYLENSPAPEITQGQSSACAHCTSVADCIDSVQREKKGLIYGNFHIHWEPSWKEMKDMGIASKEKGSYISSNLWYSQEMGLEGSDGINYKPKAIEKIDKTVDVIKQYCANEYQIQTGASSGFPFTDSNFVFKVGQKQFGHGFRIIGYNEREGVYTNYGLLLPVNCFICETTWENFGYKKESQFFLRYEDLKYLFTCHVVQWF